MQKTPAQVALRWGLQSGHSVLPKSTSEARIKENLDLFSWSIPKDLFDKISEIKQVQILGLTLFFCLFVWELQIWFLVPKRKYWGFEGKRIMGLDTGLDVGLLLYIISLVKHWFVSFTLFTHGGGLNLPLHESSQIRPKIQDRMYQIRLICETFYFQARLLRGDFAIHETGPYKSLDELWDGEIWSHNLTFTRSILWYSYWNR